MAIVGTLHNPIHFFQPVFSMTASVTIPLGLVKFISHASGQSLSMALMISRITGMVRSALKIPPAPLVSCPSMPWSSGILSSLILAYSLPTRNWVITKSASGSASFRSSVAWIFVLSPAASHIRLDRSRITERCSSPSGISTNQISSMRSSLLLFINPFISSGV